jgi:hypothetical protein
VGQQSAHISLKLSAAKSREMGRQSPPSRMKNCVVAFMNVLGCGPVGMQNMIERMIMLRN